MELSFPQVYIENNFSEQLKSFSGPAPFDKLRQACKRIRARREEKKFSAAIRFSTNRYFYFPGEPSAPRNCFENAVEMYMTAKALYPQSEPKLFYMDQGRRGTHAFTAFCHRGTVYCADPNYDSFGPFRILNGKMVNPGEEGKTANSEEVRSIREISEPALASLIGKLRTEEGIVPFLSGGGQMIEKDPAAFRPYEIFIRLDKNKLTSDLRFTDFSGSPSTAYRFESNLLDESFKVRLLLYRLENWGELIGARTLAESPLGNLEKGVVLTERKPFRYLERGCLDEYMVRWIQYVGNLLTLSKKEGKPLEETFIISKKRTGERLKRVLRKDNRPAYDFAKKRSEHFIGHMAEWTYMTNRWGLGHYFPGNERWRDLRRKKYETARKFTGNFMGLLHQVSRPEIRRFSDLNGGVFTLVKAAMRSESK